MAATEGYGARWMTFLRVEHVDLARKAYETTREQLQPKAGASNHHPLSDESGNPWHQVFEDEPLVREIKTDLDRLYPQGNEMFFQERPELMGILRNVLFVWCKQHPAVSYRQGMHDLVAVLLYAVGGDGEFAEHDVYILFSAIMTSMEPLYTVHRAPVDDTPTPVAPDAEESLFRASAPTKSATPRSPLQTLCQFIQNDLLAKHDPQLACHLQTVAVLPETYCLRWTRLLLAREFLLDDALRVWDAMFAQSFEVSATTPAVGFPLLPYLCVAILIHFSPSLRASDNTGCLQLLMRPAELNAAEIVDSALLLSNPFREASHPDMDLVEFGPGSLGVVLTTAKAPFENRLAVRDFKPTAAGRPGQAEASGSVRIGDLVESVNGVKVYGMTTDDIRKHVALLPRPLVISFLHVTDSIPGEDELDDPPSLSGPLPDFLPGEQCYAHVETSMYQPVFHPPSGSCASHYITGRLFLTNYRCAFVATAGAFAWEMPVLSIASIVAEASIVEPSADLFATSAPTVGLVCKDTQSVRFTFRNHAEYTRMFKCLTVLAYPASLTDAFCFVYRPLVLPSHVLAPFDIRRDYERVGLLRGRFRCIDQAYLLCDTYPRYLVVPAAMPDTKLQVAAAFRSSRRLPAVSWQHPINHAVICRSSQPLVGLKSARCAEDEDLVRLLCAPENPHAVAAYQSYRYVIMDARGQLAAAGNKAMGKGTESTTNYRGAKVVFMNMDNIHAIRNAAQALAAAFDPLSDDNFLAKVEASGWLKHVRLVLRGSWELAEYVHGGVSVLTHCSDGWDRTSQMVSLAELMLDPFYRTLEGFQVLVEKEWCSFGHQFGLRCGHARSDIANEQRSPIFLLWLDCVWQILRQFPTEFELNEAGLLMLADHVYSCKFGNFLFDSEKARLECFKHHAAADVWTELHGQRAKFVNADFAPQRTLLFPSTTWKNIKLWKGYFARFDPTFVPPVPKMQSY
ncbi:alpha-1,3-mannosyltransferase [Achlya hypogyna]|uniref:Alpha-1,3-mannosyltransferase n=1 Tax=Achlya hypogyna TaxID=1202772 RepID=A0A1V9YG38_ACHHY|nr:alpha-1,3-mannosyltransferase [Achlya hypogyna]